MGPRLRELTGSRPRQTIEAMVSRRIGAQLSSGKAPPSSRRLTFAEGPARLLSSPWAILIVFPSIVLASGVFLTIMGQRALRETSLEMARTRLSNRAGLAADHIGMALAQSSDMLDDLRHEALARAPTEPVEPLAATMRAMMHGRHGVSFVSVSYDDGTFRGAFVDGSGAMYFEESHVTDRGTISHRSIFEKDGRLRFLREATTEYDPRTRSFYRLADAASGRLWTEPYVFEPHYFTGITHAEALRVPADDGSLRTRAVTTVDFDVVALSELLGSSEYASGRKVLATPDGTILAYPHDVGRVGSAVVKDRILSFRDLDDPVLRAFFERPRAERSGTSDGFSLSVNGEPYLAVERKVRGVPLDWSVIELVPESVFLTSLADHSKKSAILAAAAVLCAVLLSAVFARLVVRARREVVRAREEAKRANQRATELGSYRLVECLGKGGMGEVWRGEHRLLARAAAVKLIRNDGGEPLSREAQERFRREAQSLASLRCRNTIEIYDYGVADDGTFFFVMELLNGLDLETLVREYGPQPAERVIQILVQACRSLTEAHEAGLVHRDIKPANLFLCRVADELDVVKVLDFGLVRGKFGEAPGSSTDERSPLGVTESGEYDASRASLTRADSVMGTPEFMAPEQILAGELDGRTDLYALGGVAFWLLTGTTPFHGRGTLQTLTAHLTEQPPAIVSTPERPIPEELVALVGACLSKGPSERPGTAKDLMERLRAIDVPAKARWTEREATDFWNARARAKNDVDVGTSATEVLLSGAG